MFLLLALLVGGRWQVIKNGRHGSRPHLLPNEDSAFCSSAIIGQVTTFMIHPLISVADFLVSIVSVLLRLTLVSM